MLLATATYGSNPQGCWDWWGYTGASTYNTHSGPQIKATMNMVYALG